ncbi:MAG: DUF5110 domain-containing protein [Lachnospiraceae bacterium]|nr:DUF5110 domain-containing protein [Lachnospiraceae bacterium]
MIESWQLEKNGLELRTVQGLYRIEGLGEHIFRCVYTKGRTIGEASPLDIRPLECCELNIREDEEYLWVEGKKIQLQISKETEQFTWRDLGDKKLWLQEAGKELVEIPVDRYYLEGEAPVIERVKTVDGERNFVKNLIIKRDRMAYRAKLYLYFQPEEQIHGLGQGEEGIYNYRGQNQYLYQHNMRIPVPFFLSSRGYGMLMDCGSLMTYNDDSRGTYLFLDAVEQLDYYFIGGESLDEVIGGFRELTGRAVMLPKWAFGFVQSKEAYRNQEELLEIARRYRKLQVPLDCVVQDWHTWEEDQWGNKVLDKNRYPDIQVMHQELHKLQVHSMVSVWPNMNAGTKNHKEFLEKGMLLHDDSTYNAFSPEARAVYWRQLEEELFSGGFDSWWCDSTEPFSGPDWSGAKLREPWERYALVGGEHKKYLDPPQANLFAVAHARGIYENQRKACQKKRVLNLTRSGYAGSQRYGTVLWSGDTSASWDTMRKQITEGLNFCMSGMPYWTQDVGAFFTVRERWQNRGCGHNTDPTPLWFWNGDYEEGVRDLGYRELYVRWLQYGVFLPMFRSHGTDTPREIWNFGEPGEPFFEAIRAAIELRYQLIPYIYTLAGRVVWEHDTMMRSLLFDFGGDQEAACLDQEFLFGDSLLVCPVTEPMYYERNSREIKRDHLWKCYLPQGCGWYDFWTGAHLEGGQWIEAWADLERIPLFIREGSILPMESGLQYAGQETENPLEIHVYPGADGHFRLYEDAGDGYGYENGEYQWISLEWRDEEQTLFVGSCERIFPQGMKGRTCVLILGNKRKEFVYKGKALQVPL